MKKNELKRVLKPLIKECIRECLFEEGVLSGIITEVVSGLSNQRIVTEGITIEKKQSPPDDNKKAKRIEQQRQERIKKLNEKLSFGNIDIFEGTQEILAEPTKGNPLSGVGASDAGVDITDIVNLAGQNWKNLI